MGYEWDWTVPVGVFEGCGTVPDGVLVDDWTVPAGVLEGGRIEPVDAPDPDDEVAAGAFEALDVVCCPEESPSFSTLIFAAFFEINSY